MEPSRQVWFVSTRGSGVISNVHPPSMSYCFGGDQALIDIVIEIVRRQFHGAASPGSARRQSESRRGSAFTLGAHFRLHQTSSSSARLEKISRSSYPLGMYSYMYRQCGASIHSSHIVHGLCTYMHSSYIVHDSAAETPTASCSALKHRRGAVCSPTSTRAPRPLPPSASAPLGLCLSRGAEPPWSRWNLRPRSRVFPRSEVVFPGQKSCVSQVRGSSWPRPSTFSDQALPLRPTTSDHPPAGPLVAFAEWAPGNCEWPFVDPPSLPSRRVSRGLILLLPDSPPCSTLSLPLPCCPDSPGRGTTSSATSSTHIVNATRGHQHEVTRTSRDAAARRQRPRRPAQGRHHGEKGGGPGKGDAPCVRPRRRCQSGRLHLWLCQVRLSRAATLSSCP